MWGQGESDAGLLVEAPEEEGGEGDLAPVRLRDAAPKSRKERNREARRREAEEVLEAKQRLKAQRRQLQDLEQVSWKYYCLHQLS